MSKVYFISDLHFGHKYVIAFDKRPFKDVQEMEAEMIRRWNARVSPEDHVFVVGDMFGSVTTAHAGEIVHTLNGKIHLIRGNHDPKGELFESLFEEVVPSKAIQGRVRGEKQRVIMRHRLLPIFKGNDEGVVQLYGHTHGSAVADMEDRYIHFMNWLGVPMHSFNVGACRMDYEPRTLEEILEGAGKILPSKTEQ
jgi:calcineurin-like phosphoesterase family protein